MTSGPATQRAGLLGVFSVSRNEIEGWATSLLVAAFAHIALFLTILPKADHAVADAGSPVIMLEIAPELVAPTEPLDDAQPGPPQPEPASEAQRREEKKIDPSPEPPKEVAMGDPEIIIPVEKQPVKDDAKKEQDVQPERPPPAALPKPAVVAPAPAAPAPGQTDAPAARKIASWQLQLVAHIEKFKRYPRAARPAQGVVDVAFRIDRAGRLVEAHVTQSSGSPLLDAEAVAMLTRAQPLPKPPSEAPDDQLVQVVPVRYRVGTP